MPEKPSDSSEEKPRRRRDREKGNPKSHTITVRLSGRAYRVLEAKSEEQQASRGVVIRNLLGEESPPKFNEKALYDMKQSYDWDIANALTINGIQIMSINEFELFVDWLISVGRLDELPEIIAKWVNLWRRIDPDSYPDAGWELYELSREVPIQQPALWFWLPNRVLKARKLGLRHIKVKKRKGNVDQDKYTKIRNSKPTEALWIIRALQRGEEHEWLKPQKEAYPYRSSHF